jgi:carboxypeptidase Q
MKETIIFTILLIGLTAQANYAQHETSAHQRLINAARFLEEKPFDKEAKSVRSWAVMWSAATKDVTVVLCGGTASPLLDKKAKFGSELVGQYLVSMTAFKLENPDKADNENAAQLAGLNSVIKTYENMLKKNPKAKFEAVDTLLAKRNNGELEKYVADANCGRR